MNPFADLTGMLPTETIDSKLHYFNLTHDFSVLRNIHPLQEVSFMYPDVIRRVGQSDEDYEKGLVELFGELDEQHAKMYEEWKKTKQANQEN